MSSLCFVRARAAPEATAALSADGFVVMGDAGHRWLEPGPSLAAEIAESRAAGARPWVVVGEVEQVRAAAAAGGDLWLRGLEAAGPCGSFSALVLLRAAAATGRPFVIEGLSVRGMAASLAVGAAGIVLDAALWLTRESMLPEEQRALVRSATSGHDTLVEGELGSGQLARRLVRGPRSMPAPQNVADARHHDGQPLLEAARAVVAEVQQHLQAARGLAPWGAEALVQGPMANVAEGTGLARAVREAGAMPFAALGALDPEQARQVLDGFAREVPPPWGVGVIGFDVMPHRDAHLDAIAALGDRGPQVVTLAGASPSLATELARRGKHVWLHTPSARLTEQALAASVPGVLLEGHEAGGHVGRLTAAGLWEEGLAAAERHMLAGHRLAGGHMLDGQGLEGGVTPVVGLAGGIGDPVSAAFARAMGARASQLGVRVLLQAGTAFLLTHEAAERGQVTPIYQARALSARTTVLVGSSVNLPLRCAPNAFTEEARAQELAWEREGVPRAERRLRLEHHNLGRTRIAARGIERDPSGTSRYRPVPPARQDREGAFTVGQGAVTTARVQSVSQLVADLTREAHTLLSRASTHAPVRPRWPSVVAVRARPSLPLSPAGSPSREGDIAIIGMGCVLPGALDVESFLHNLVQGVDAIGPVPPERWAEHRYYDPQAGTTGPAKSYSRHAGVVRGFRFDPLPFRIPPRVVATMDPSQQLALAAAAQAVRAAGLEQGSFDKRRAGVVFGNAMGGEYAKDAALRVRFREVMDAVVRDDALGGLSVQGLAELEARVEDQLSERLPPVDVDSMAGLLSNVVAGRVAAWLDWMGGNLTVDAACAASLAALSVAVDWLRLGRCDVVLTGGVDTDLAPESYVGFCRTQALSRTGSSPFSAHADGFVMGEGAAVFVLKRLPDALRDGDDIWATIRGVGSSSDGRGRGITAPRPEGQALALERAYAEAGLTPADIGLIEAHGTGTALGDQTEVGVLARHFASGQRPTWLGSVKSMIGHLKSAAGAASLLKVALALRSGVIPPTLHAGPLEPSLSFDKTPFLLPRRPVLLPEDRPRASVSAFGFGGTNYHVLLEAPSSSGASSRAAPSSLRSVRAWASRGEAAAWRPQDTTPLLLPFGAPTFEGLLEAVRGDAPCTAGQAAASAHRAVTLSLSGPPGRPDALQRLETWLASGPRPGSALGREAFYGQGPAPAVTLGFPGQGAPREGALDAVSRWPAGARVLAALDAAVQQSLSDGLSLAEREGRSDPLSQHAVLYAVSVAWAEVLAVAGIPVAGALGHSLGAYAALAAAGAAEAHALLGPVLARGRALQDCPPAGMVAVQLPEAEARALAQRHGLSLAALNGPDRCTLSGASPAVAAVAAALGASRARVLDVERAYHSPLVSGAIPRVQEALAGLAFALPRTAVWSARAAAPLQPERLAEDLVAGIVEPVRFDPAVRAMLERGHTLWIEAGPGTTVSRIVEAAGGTAVPLDTGEHGLAVAAGWLLALGHPGLAELAPGTWLARALPAVAPAQPLPPRRIVVDSPRPAPPPPMNAASMSTAPGELAARAERVVDLRIAALAEPSVAEPYRQARQALVQALARQDLALALGGAPDDGVPRHEAPVPRRELGTPANGHGEDGHAGNGSPGPLLVTQVLAMPAVPEPAQVAEPDTDELRSGVLAAICEVTGYPPELITEGADLERELGIDSIRKMEILGLLEKRFGFTTAESDYTALAEANLAVLIGHVRTQLAKVGQLDQTGRVGQPAPAPRPPDDERLHLAVPLARRLPRRAPAQDGAGAPVLRVAAGQEPEQVILQLSSSILPDPLVALVAQDAGGSAAAAFLRSAARELGRPCRIVHLQGGAPEAELGGDESGEVWVGPRGRWERVPLAVSLSPGDGLPRRPVLLVTGGVRGIVLPCLRALADLEPQIVLLGRTPREQAEPLLAPHREAGLQIHYVVADVTEAVDVQAAVAEARRLHGRIDLVLHAAGVLRDGPVGSVPEEELRRVMRTKWTGAQHLLQATAQDELSVFCTFSSLVAWLGNAAQTGYAAANAAMETLRHPRAKRSLSIAWTAWSEVGMAADPALRALLASRGVRSIPPSAGARAFRELLLSETDGTVLVSAQPLPRLVSADWPLGDPAWARDGWRFPVPLDPQDRALADHQVGRRPLVPAALWFAALIEGARTVSGREGSWMVERFEILAPTFVDRVRTDVSLQLAPTGEAWEATIRAGGAAVCRARVAPCEDPLGSPPPRPLVGGESAEGLYRPDLLFHGPAWQVLRQTRTENGRAFADVVLDEAGSPVAGAMDGVHQLLAAWSGRQVGWLGLPVGADRWITSGSPPGGSLRIETHTTTSSAQELSADVVARDDSGRVVLRGEGVRLRAASSRSSDA
jgi:acyl transferase domain-containing protein/NAD(P)H-dependent flavin oxidoreductase YrpB (nitropropane dioxygenase family)/acyl carrier protein